jgi:hypothetical protein
MARFATGIRSFHTQTYRSQYRVQSIDTVLFGTSEEEKTHEEI